MGPDAVPSLAAVSSSPSGLPPGAGNEADQAKKAKADESKEIAHREPISGDRLVVADRHAATVRRDDDGDQILARVVLTHDPSPKMRFAESRPRSCTCPPPPNVRYDLPDGPWPASLMRWAGCRQATGRRSALS